MVRNRAIERCPCRDTAKRFTPYRVRRWISVADRPIKPEFGKIASSISAMSSDWIAPRRPSSGFCVSVSGVSAFFSAFADLVAIVFVFLASGASGASVSPLSSGCSAAFACASRSRNSSSSFKSRADRAMASASGSASMIRMSFSYSSRNGFGAGMRFSLRIRPMTCASPFSSSRFTSRSIMPIALLPAAMRASVR